MRVVTLASSSKGNCSLIYTANTKILIDMGIKLDECEMKLQALGINPKDIDVILNTHAHGDHTKGMGAFARKYGTKLYVHVDGRDSLIAKIGKTSTKYVNTFTELPFNVGEFIVTAFKLPHDVPCCVGYSVVCGDNKVSYATDLGDVTPDIVDNLMGSKLVILESNHDEKMLIANPEYPFILKNRILSKNGHLCNEVSAQVVLQLALTGTKQVVLAHLSEENNTPNIAYNCVAKHLEKHGLIEGTHIRVDVAPASKIGTLFHLK